MAGLDRAIQYAVLSVMRKTDAAEYWIIRPDAQLRTRRGMTNKGGRSVQMQQMRRVDTERGHDDARQRQRA